MFKPNNPCIKCYKPQECDNCEQVLIYQNYKKLLAENQELRSENSLLRSKIEAQSDQIHTGFGGNN